MGKNKSEYACKCYKITKEEIKDKMRSGITDFKQLKKETKIGKSCSSCKKKNKKRFEKYLTKLNANNL